MSVAAMREAKRKQEEEELRKKLELRRKKMEEQKALLEEDEKKEKQLRESRKAIPAAELERRRKEELEKMAAKLEEERRLRLEEELKRQAEEENKKEADKEAQMKAEMSSLMDSSKKAGEAIQAVSKSPLSPRHKPAPPHLHKPPKHLTESERSRRIEKLTTDSQMFKQEDLKKANEAASKPKMLKRAETILFRPVKGSPAQPKADDRKMKDVPRPISSRLDEAVLFDMKGVPNPDMLKVHFVKEGRITVNAAKRLIAESQKLFEKLPNILELNAPIEIVGDIHGQYYDLLHMMKKAGHPKDTPYLFMGDYVDRGMFATEVVFYLFACKLAYPNTFHLLRGNHEGRGMTNYFNFRRECCKKYGEDIYHLLMTCFDTLPLCAMVTGEYGRFLCMHGGLSPFIHSVDDIKAIDRVAEVPNSGPYCDLLWSDPVEEKTFEDWQVYDLNRYRKIDFDSNPGRNLSFTYGYKFAKEFCEENNLISIVRAHEVQKEGYMKHWFGKQDRENPYVITIFSAPNYTDTHGNKGAYLHYTGKAYTIETFEHDPHPYVLPNFQDGVSWSLPFVAEYSARIFAQMVAMMSEEDENGNDEVQQSIKKKLHFLLRTVAGYKLERMQKENELKESQTPVDTSFEDVTKADAKNEAAPTDLAVVKTTKKPPMLKRASSASSLKKFF